MGNKPTDANLRSRLTPGQYHLIPEHGTKRAFAGAHLGHVCADGPQLAGRRSCIDSTALDFKPESAP